MRIPGPWPAIGSSSGIKARPAEEGSRIVRLGGRRLRRTVEVVRPTIRVVFADDVGIAA
jgi:hypothetical protein